MENIGDYFEQHPKQYFAATFVLSAGALLYEGKKALQAVIEDEPVNNKGRMALAASGCVLSVVGLADQRSIPTAE